MTLRTPLGRVLGLGSAKEGTEHWWSQRVTAVALVPLTLWFVFSMVFAYDYQYDTLAAWLENPVNAVLTLLLATTLLYHSKLGIQVVVEDYLHGSVKVLLLLVSQFVHIGLAVAAVFAVLKISLG